MIPGGACAAGPQSLDPLLFQDPCAAANEHFL